LFYVTKNQVAREENPPYKTTHFLKMGSKPKTLRKRTPVKKNSISLRKLGLFVMGGPLAPGSWFGNHPTKKPFSGVGVLTIKLPRNREQNYLE